MDRPPLLGGPLRGHWMTTREQRIRHYFHAKDENRPHLMAQAFAEDATLEMVLKTAAISFPSKASGREAITEALVRQFGRSYENVYSFCLQRPDPSSDPSRFDCDWLVAMSVKDTGEVRVGCGRYEWRFQREAPFLASHLRITIEAMQLLPPDALSPVMRWIGQLPYPWCSPHAVANGAPAHAELQPILAYAAR